MGKNNSLEEFKLYYEDLERKPVKTVPVKSKKTAKSNPKKAAKTVNKQKIDLKKRFEDSKKAARGFFDNTKKSLFAKRKKAKKPTKAQKKIEQEQRKRGILGIGLLLVVASIAYSTSVIFIGVDSSASRIVLFPQALFALITLVRAFSKLYK